VAEATVTTETRPKGTGKTIIVFSSDLDRVLAAFNIAVGAAAMGFDVHMYFTFWGLNVLRKGEAKAGNKSAMDRVFARRMPKGPENLSLSKMHMMGLGTRMMKRIMKRKNVALLPELVETAQESGVKFIACQMSMDVMGIKREELIDGVDISGVAGYLEVADNSSVNLFI
jgi:peroxiredoxin family protein